MRHRFLAFMLAGASVASQADCPAPLPRDLPTIPDGMSASVSTMAQAGEAARLYVRALEAYLDCRDALHPLQYNYLVDQAEKIAGDYNEELAKFYRRSDMLATK